MHTSRRKRQPQQRQLGQRQPGPRPLGQRQPGQRQPGFLWYIFFLVIEFFNIKKNGVKICLANLHKFFLLFRHVFDPHK